MEVLPLKKDDVQFYMAKDHKQNILKAKENLKDVLKPTPLIKSDFYSAEYNCDVYLKPENFQNTGSFKIRGAYNKIANMGPNEAAKGIIASSAGNHAQGVAYSAQKKGIKATIVMPNVTPLLKVEATKSLQLEIGRASCRERV